MNPPASIKSRETSRPYADPIGRGGTCLPRPAIGPYSLFVSLRQLTRAELSAMVALSAMAGYLFAGIGWQRSGLLLAIGIWLLAAGCSALNQWQEQDLDSRMERTRQRPLPAGNLTRTSVLWLSLTMIAGGLLLLAATGVRPLLLGLLATIWYNGIYTPLKRHSAFAALPGAICGALPPLIGWSATGQSLLAPEILILAGTLFLWQLPHTWLLLCHYRLDLQRSGLPDLFEKISTTRLLRINHCWLAALALCYLLFPLFGLISSRPLSLIYIVGLGALTTACVQESRKGKERFLPLRLFHLINLSMAMLLLTLITDSLL